MSPSSNIPQNAFLIVNGSRVFLLEEENITIGRMFDNDLVINDNRVSRYHARLEAKSGVFYLIDLNSTGGTSVNGANKSSAELTHGDVISLAGVPIIYGKSTSGYQPPTSTLADSKNPELNQKPSVTDAHDITDPSDVDDYLKLFDVDSD